MRRSERRVVEAEGVGGEEACEGEVGSVYRIDRRACLFCGSIAGPEDNG